MAQAPLRVAERLVPAVPRAARRVADRAAPASGAIGGGRSVPGQPRQAPRRVPPVAEQVAPQRGHRWGTRQTAPAGRTGGGRAAPSGATAGGPGSAPAGPQVADPVAPAGPQVADRAAPRGARTAEQPAPARRGWLSIRRGDRNVGGRRSGNRVLRKGDGLRARAATDSVEMRGFSAVPVVRAAEPPAVGTAARVTPGSARERCEHWATSRTCPQPSGLRPPQPGLRPALTCFQR
jgi:hypothetical protein